MSADTDTQTEDTDSETDGTGAYIVETPTDDVSIKTRVEASNRQAAINRFLAEVTSHPAVNQSDDREPITTYTAVGGASVELTINPDALIAYPDSEYEQQASETGGEE